MFRIGIGLLAAFFSTIGLHAPAEAQDSAPATYAVSVTQDITYATALVHQAQQGGESRPLLMDVYRPVVDSHPLANRPTVILLFGGSFHRGSRGEDNFEEDGAAASSIADYCRLLARAGYVCAAIDYRLVPDDPVVAAMPDPANLLPSALLTGPAATARIELVRQAMGLPPFDTQSRATLWHTYLAATEDLGSAVQFLRGHGDAYGIDPERIAVGGFSAGAITAINGAYGMRLPVKAVISMSGGIGAYDLRVTARPGMPAGLFFFGQNDLSGILVGGRAALSALAAQNIPTENAWVPGFGHFYPMGAVTLASDLSRQSLAARMLDFLGRRL